MSLSLLSTTDWPPRFCVLLATLLMQAAAKDERVAKLVAVDVQ